MTNERTSPSSFVYRRSSLPHFGQYDPQEAVVIFRGDGAGVHRGGQFNFGAKVARMDLHLMIGAGLARILSARSVNGQQLILHGEMKVPIAHPGNFDLHDDPGFGFVNVGKGTPRGPLRVRVVYGGDVRSMDPHIHLPISTSPTQYGDNHARGDEHFEQSRNDKKRHYQPYEYFKPICQSDQPPIHYSFSGRRRDQAGAEIDSGRADEDG